MLPIKQNFLGWIPVGVSYFRDLKKDLAFWGMLILNIYVTFELFLSNSICVYFSYSFKKIHSDFLKSGIFLKGKQLRGEKKRLETCLFHLKDLLDIYFSNHYFKKSKSGIYENELTVGLSAQ